MSAAARSDLAEPEVLTTFIDGTVESIDDLTETLATFLSPQITKRRVTVIAQHELIRESTRPPALVPLVEESSLPTADCGGGCAARLGSVNHHSDAQVLVAAIDGLLLDRFPDSSGRADPRRLPYNCAVSSQASRQGDEHGERFGDAVSGRQVASLPTVPRRVPLSHTARMASRESHHPNGSRTGGGIEGRTYRSERNA